MDIQEARLLARALMNRYGLRDWWCYINPRLTHLYGRCLWKEKTLAMSKAFVELNTPYETKKMVLHEMAHAITGEGHTRRFYDCLQRLYAREKIADQPQREYSRHRIDKYIRPRPAKPRKKNPKTVFILCPRCGRKDEERVHIPVWFRWHMATDSEGQVYRISSACMQLTDFIRSTRGEKVKRIPTRDYQLCWDCRVPLVLMKEGKLVRGLNDHPEYPLHPVHGYFEDEEATAELKATGAMVRE